jgi:hypothetical protein
MPQSMVYRLFFFTIGISPGSNCSIAEHIDRSCGQPGHDMNVDEPRAMDALQQCFSSTGAERALQARRQFFEAGIRPSGLVSEAVIQSWLRSQRQHCNGRRLALAPVSPSRLHATQERCRSLLQALQHELPTLEQALAGTGTRVMLTDDKGIVLHVSRHPCGPVTSGSA